MATPASQKRAIDETVSRMEKDLSSKKKLEVVQEYLESVTTIEKCEIEILEKRIKIKTLEDKFPDLKQLGGMANKIFNGKYWRTELNSKEIVLHGKNRKEAEENHQKKLNLETLNAEKMKETKKAKMGD